MDLAAIIARMDEWAVERRASGVHVTDRSLSLEATGSPDTIRNWRRALDAGRRPGANLDTIRKLAAAMGVPVELLLTGEPEPQPSELSALDGQIISHLDQLTDEEKALLLAAAEGFAARRQGEGR